MLKRIDLSQVRAGMFIEDMEGSWGDNPLQKRRFLLDGVDADVLRSSGLTVVLINTAKGTDVADSVASESRSEPVERHRRQVEAAMETLRKSSGMLKDMFASVGTGGPVSLDATGEIAFEISKSVDDNPAVFISVTRLKSKDETTFLHSVAVSALMIHFGHYLRLEKTTVQMLGVAGLLHDIGKLEVPHAILNKQGTLDEAEMGVMRGHPMMGYNILSRQDDMPDMVLDICRHHHERIDGRGYPDRISGRQFTKLARLAAICDVYDAVTSSRPYKKPWSSSEALRWMSRRDGHFDSQLLKKFMLCLAVTQPLSN